MANLSEEQIFQKLSCSKLPYTINRRRIDGYSDSTEIVLTVEFEKIGNRSYAYPSLQACWMALELDLTEILKNVTGLLKC